MQESQIDEQKMVQIVLPKQGYLDKILKIIERNILKGMHLPFTIKENQAGYLSGPYFQGNIPVSNTE